MKSTLIALTFLSLAACDILKPETSQKTEETQTNNLTQEDPNFKPSDKDLQMQEEFMKQFEQMYSQLPSGLDDQKMNPESTQETQLNNKVQDDSTLNQDASRELDVMNQEDFTDLSNQVSTVQKDTKQQMSNDVPLANTLSPETPSTLDNTGKMSLTSETDQDTTKKDQTSAENTTLNTQKTVPVASTNTKQNQTEAPYDDYKPVVFKKPLAKSLSEARKLEDDDKMEDIEKRLFSIEDKVDHLLMHAGHDLTPHKLTWTPWGMHVMPNYHNPDSLHQKLSMIDHMFGHGGYMGGAGMGHMGYGMGMMGHPMGGYGSMMSMMGYGHNKLGLGHLNPYGYGLDNVHGGWNMWNVTGLGRRASYSGSSNPYYTGSGSII
jgi:hypothetical protein